MAAQQGDGARDQANQGVQPQGHGQTDAHRVLYHDEHGNHAQKNHQTDTTFAQFGKVGSQTDGGEKNEHEGRLQAAFKAQCQACDFVQGKDDGGHHQATGHRLGDVEVAQHAHALHQEFAEQQYQHGQDEGVVGAELEVHTKPAF